MLTAELELLISAARMLTLTPSSSKQMFSSFAFRKLRKWGTPLELEKRAATAAAAAAAPYEGGREREQRVVGDWHKQGSFCCK